MGPSVCILGLLLVVSLIGITVEIVKLKQDKSRE